MQLFKKKNLDKLLPSQREDAIISVPLEITQYLNILHDSILGHASMRYILGCARIVAAKILWNIDFRERSGARLAKRDAAIARSYRTANRSYGSRQPSRHREKRMNRRREKKREIEREKRGRRLRQIERRGESFDSSLQHVRTLFLCIGSAIGCVTYIDCNFNTIVQITFQNLVNFEV